MPINLPDIDPVLIHLGPVAIRWYALAYVAGIIAGWLYVGRLVKTESLWAPRKPPVEAPQLDDLILWLTLGIILGGRIGYILAYDMSLIWKKPLEIFMIWQGGMSFHGGFLGVVVAGLLYCRSQKFDAPRMLNLGDLLACAAPFGLLFGRLANFVNGELWGRPTDAPWGMIFCNKFIEQQYGGDCPAGLYPRHPSQLYEAFTEGLLLFAILFVLVYVYRQFKRPGLIMGVFVAGYGIFRIIIENFREPDEQMLPFFKNVITMGQSLSLLMVIGGGFYIWNALRKPAETEAETPQLDG